MTVHGTGNLSHGVTGRRGLDNDRNGQDQGSGGNTTGPVVVFAGDSINAGSAGLTAGQSHHAEMLMQSQRANEQGFAWMRQRW